MELKTDDLNTIKKSINDIATYVSLYLKLSKETNIQTKILDGFLNKGISFVNSIFILTNHNQYGESIILYRCLIERLLFLKYIIENNKYEEYDNWSFVKNYEQKNTARTFKKYNKNVSSDNLKSSKEDTLKYQNLKKNKPNWKEPDLEKYSKKIGYGHLYKLGYDFGSSYVHSRSDEGINDFEQNNRLKPKNNPQIISIQYNSLLVCFSIFDECISNSNLKSLNKINEYKLIIDNYFENKELLQLSEIEFKIRDFIFKEATKNYS